MALIFRNRAPDGSLDLTTTRGQVGILAFIGLLLFLGVAASFSAFVKWQSNGANSLEPSRGWLDVLEIASNIILVWNGVVLGFVGVKRLTPNAEGAAVAARQASGVAATPPAVPGRNIPRNSAPVETVKPAQSAISAEAKPTERRSWLEGDDDRPKLTDNDAGIL